MIDRLKENWDAIKDTLKENYDISKVSYDTWILEMRQGLMNRQPLVITGSGV